MVTRLIGLIVFLCVSVPGYAAGTVGYGSRVGMVVDVVSMSGLDTPNAIIRTKHSQADATAFCRDYVRKVTSACIKNELAVPLNDSITADCSAGIFTDFQGNKHQFLGPNPDKDAAAKFKLLDMVSNELADGSEASNYPTDMAIFHALCPRAAPLDF